MIKIFTWFSKNPSVFVSLVAALISASVALIVFIVGQILIHKRERTQFLVNKLEELYLLLNSVSEDNAKFFKLIYLCLEGDTHARQEICSMDDLNLYGHRTAKRIIMYIRLYFPRLSKIHQLLFAAQRELNQLIFQLHSDSPPNLADVITASGQNGHFIRLMEAEIIRNRDFLLKDYFFFKKYKETTIKEIEAKNLPPDGPIMNFPAN